MKWLFKWISEIKDIVNSIWIECIWNRLRVHSNVVGFLSVQRASIIHTRSLFVSVECWPSFRCGWSKLQSHATSFELSGNTMPKMCTSFKLFKKAVCFQRWQFYWRVSLWWVLFMRFFLIFFVDAVTVTFISGCQNYLFHNSCERLLYILSSK